MDAAFEVPGAPWMAVSPSLTTVRRTSIGIVTVAGLIVLATARMLIGDQVPWPVPAIALLAVLVASTTAWVLAGRDTAAWAWAERESDLAIRHGILVRHLEVVPYGRMQLVEVTAGPLQRRAGIATVKLRTAAPGSDARIPGVPASEASRLRDRLTARGEAQAAGL